MATVAEQPPQPKPGLGCCLGKGCLILIVFFFFLVIALCVGGYFGLRTFTSNEPRELPAVATSEEQQQEVLQRWDNFENAVHENRNRTESGVADVDPQSQATTVPNQPAANPRIELTGGDINQMIAANRRSRGKAFVSIEDGVGHVAVSIPISKKTGFSDRYLNVDFEVRSAPDGDLGGIQITARSPRGVQVPGRLLNLLLGARSIRGWVDPYISQYRSEYDVSTFKIVGNKVVLEAGRSR
jgi:hypothetical protein